MNKPQTLSTAPLETLVMDYARLRQLGIQLLEQLGDQNWTDFNAHDPGITILEQLCYALTDLGNRIHYDLPDLLAEGRSADDTTPLSSLYTPAQILPIQPVSLLDLRKWLIDVEDIKNVWVETVDKTEPGLFYDASAQTLYLDNGQPLGAHCSALHLTGIYRVLLETDEKQSVSSAIFLPKVRQRLHACRHLGADFLPPQELPHEAITVLAKIEIGKVENPTQLLADIWHALSLAISPRIRFWSLSERRAMGQEIDTIFDGPLLQKGFIDDAELTQFQRKTGLRSSDLLQVLMAVPGVTLITALALANNAMLNDVKSQFRQFFNDDIAEYQLGHAWYLTLDPQKTPIFNANINLEHGGSIGLYRNGIRVQVDCVAALKLLKEKREHALPAGKRDIPLPRGRNRQVGRYYSIQHQFPALYGIGSDGLPDSSPAKRQAQSRQLKAYLLFFDQLLANYFAQLAHVKDLFSFDTPELSTYFTQTIADPEQKLDLASLYVNPATYAKQLAELGAKAASDQRLGARKQRFLNHLLARFGEQLTDYTLAQASQANASAEIAVKSAFLQQYRDIGLKRPSAFDYTQQAAENISGLELRIRGLLGLPAANRQPLASEDDLGIGGFYLLEHILLRPGSMDVENIQKSNYLSRDCPLMANVLLADPYSQRISFIFPQWNKRFQQAQFKHLIEKTLRDETPAHLHVNICWLAKEEMQNFETAFTVWRKQTIASQAWDPPKRSEGDHATLTKQLQLRDARDALIRLIKLGQPWPLRDLRLSYPPIVAFDTTSIITIHDAQCDCRYQLCDEDGNLIDLPDAGSKQLPTQWCAAFDQSLGTPPIKKDVVFTILATRETGQAGDMLDTWLAQTVSIQVGINTCLVVNFVAKENQHAQGSCLIADYDDHITVTIKQSQAGISYVLVDDGVDVSAPVIGNKDCIRLDSNTGFKEDTSLKIRAYRTEKQLPQNALDQVFLATELPLKVRPNPALKPLAVSNIVDFNDGTSISIAGAQSSVEYRLYRRFLSLADYLDTPAEGEIQILADENRTIALRAPVAISNWSKPDDFTYLGRFSSVDGTSTIETGPLDEDAMFIVQALKKGQADEPHLQLRLTHAFAVLVRPDPRPTVNVEHAEVASGTKGMITVKNTQLGVHYQLCRADDTPVNPAGYHWQDRGIGSMRLEVDLRLRGNEPIDPVLQLPTKPLTEVSHFKVLAIKTITKLSAELTGKASIKIKS